MTIPSSTAALAPPAFARLVRLQTRAWRTLGHHGRDVGRLALLASAKAGIPAGEQATVFRAGVLHDIGKLYIDGALLEQSRPLTESEFVEVREHVVHSVEILRGAGIPEREVALVAAHHERPDGTGYPRGLQGDEIDPGAQLIAAADAFCAMVENRPYARPLTLPRAARELEAGVGSQFGQEAAEAVLATAGAAVATRGPERKALAAVLHSDPTNLTRFDT